MFHYLMHSFWPSFAAKPEAPGLVPLPTDNEPSNEGSEFMDDAIREEDIDARNDDLPADVDPFLL